LKFAGKTILVTGASGGIGGATARRLVAEGADVIASSRDTSLLVGLVAETGVRALELDLSSHESIMGAVEGLDVWGVVNCGGFGGELANPQDTDIDVFDKVVSVNTRGALLVIKYAAQSMIRIGNGGSIVNVSSQAALIALSGHVSYAASKAALDSITRVSALELGPHNIRVNSVNPTVVITRMTERYWGRPEIMEAFLAKMPLGRYARPDDIAGPIAFLLSEDSQMISGTTLPVDGGYTAC
jgi:NAD(P)-dependent dehydrogenase (short-subunit alcohol dehydrogenase family)